MLKTLRLHNFRTYLNAEFAFTQRHLLIGANNSGKTNLCAALGVLGRSAWTNLDQSVQAVPGGVGEITNAALDSKIVELSFTCELPVEGKPRTYSYDLALRIEASAKPSEKGTLAVSVVREVLAATGTGTDDVNLLQTAEPEGEPAGEEPVGWDHWAESAEGCSPQHPRDVTTLSKLQESADNREALLVREYMSRWHYYALSPLAMRNGWRKSPAAEWPIAPLAPLGDNLASCLYRMKNWDETRYRRVIDHVQSMVEADLEAVNFAVAPGQAPVPFVALRNRPDGASWEGLSDGTLRCLGFAYIVEAATPSLVLIEEPENGVHPGQLRTLIDLFEERAPQTQFLFTSHSPYFINFFDGSRDSVTLLRRNKERTEIIRVPPAEDDPDRPLLAEQYSMELF